MSIKKLESFLNLEAIPDEAEIISRFDNNKPTVSVFCICYNHGEYIAEAIKGFLIQKTYYPFEIIIHDDCSVDGSQSIIAEYKANYPNLISVIYQEENVYKVDKQAPLRNCLELSRGNYIALCEGDDFWFSENKLHNQMDMLLKNKDFAMVINSGYMGGGGTSAVLKHCYYGEKNIRFKDSDVILKKGQQFAPTASYLFKRDVISFVYDVAYRKISVTDLFIELYAIKNGGIVYAPEATSYYRLTTQGSWSAQMKSGGVDALIHYLCSLDGVISADEYLSSLDWSYKKAYVLLSIAVASLKSGDIRGYYKYIELSLSQKKLPGLKFSLLYSIKSCPSLVMALLNLSNK